MRVWGCGGEAISKRKEKVLRLEVKHHRGGGVFPLVRLVRFPLCSDWYFKLKSTLSCFPKFTILPYTYLVSPNILMTIGLTKRIIMCHIQWVINNSMWFLKIHDQTFFTFAAIHMHTASTRQGQKFRNVDSFCNC